MNITLHQQFVEQSIYRIEENTPRISRCLAELSDAEIWQRPNAVSNSAGNLILHLCGNITQYILSALGEQPDHRNRDMEFALVYAYPRQELLEQLQQTVSKAIEVIASLSEEQLLARRSVQGFDLTGVGIILHVVEHFSYHTGQIAFLTKMLKEKDLGFYAGLNLNMKNKF